MSEYTEEQARADADALVARLESDPTFAEALKSDPHGALTDAGIPEDTVNELVGVLSAGSDGSEVEGFGMGVGIGDTTVCAHQSLAFQPFIGHAVGNSDVCGINTTHCVGS